MTRRQIAALVVGAIATVLAFSLGMFLLIMGDYSSTSQRILAASFGLAPVALVAAMIGYAVWWLAMFVMALGSPEKKD